MTFGKIGARPLVKSWTARDYVQDGLIAMWDGIENAGWGVHDASATVWKNLMNNQDLSIPAHCIWSTNSLVWTENGALGMTISNVSDVKNIEMVFSVQSFWPNNSYGAIFCADGYAQGSAGVSGPVGALRANSSVKSLCVNSLDQNTIVSGLSEDVLISISYSVSDGSIRAYQNGAFVLSVSYTPNLGNIVINDLAGYLGRSRKISVASIRLSSRALTASEIAANYAVDKARFNLP